MCFGLCMLNFVWQIERICVNKAGLVSCRLEEVSTWFRSCLMECCRVRMWLNRGLCRVSLRFPMVSLWVHSSRWTSLACSRSRAPSTCCRSAEDTEEEGRTCSCHRNLKTCQRAALAEDFTCWDIFKHGRPSLPVCLSLWIRNRGEHLFYFIPTSVSCFSLISSAVADHV